MRNRVLCALLALAMVLVMLPTTAVPVLAASQMVSSDDLINCIKEYEGFRSEAYLSGGVWSIGYGTSAKPGDTVTETEAEQALRAHLHSLEATVNRFADKYSLKLTQNQFDALTCFSYNCGEVWMNQNGRFRDAVVKGASENEFLFAISLWANNGSAPDPGLLKRRMAEADMYLNGVYLQKSDTYTYSIFDANGGTPGSSGEDKMQGYRLNGQTPILVKDPTRTGYTFAGWFTQQEGGTQVTELGSATAGKRLYAHYLSEETSSEAPEQEGTGDGNTQVLFTGTVRCSTYVNVRQGPGTGSPVVSRAVNGTKVEIFETSTVGTVKWGRIRGGWISMDYVEPDKTEGSDKNEAASGSSEDSGGQDGTVTAYNVNVRSGPGTQYGIVCRVTSGQKVTVYEQKTSGSLNWGRIGTNQWICLAYVRLGASGGESASGGTESATVQKTVTGKVNVVNLNVRSGPGTNYQRVGSFGAGAMVTIFEQTTGAGTRWGRIANDRWVCMDYITLVSEEEAKEESNSGSDTGSTQEGDPAKVTGAAQLNVRSGPGTNYPRVRFLNRGTEIRICEYRTENGTKWGRIGVDQWVCMSYVTLESGTASNGGSAEDSRTGTGTVISKTSLNVRSAAGIGNSLVGRLAPGTKVEILRTTRESGAWWGETSQGWVCMDYIRMNG